MALMIGDLLPIFKDNFCCLSVNKGDAYSVPVGLKVPLALEK